MKFSNFQSLTKVIFKNISINSILKYIYYSFEDNLKKSAQLFLENEIEPAIDSVLNEIRSKKLPELRELVLKMLNVLKSDGDAASVEKAKKYNARLSNYWFS